MANNDAPKQILSLDGGGVRGVISVAFLERIEALYREKHKGRAVRLADHFALVGGTSTGSIIGTAIALGMSASEIKDFYFELAPRVFKRSRFRLIGIQSLFDAQALQEELRNVIGTRTLDSSDLLTHLAIVTKRMDTGSAWIVTTNSAAKYWHDPADGSYIGNRNYRLAEVVRASTAAPYFFSPEEIRISDDEPAGLFVDGGLTPHNNPAMALLQLATIPAYGFNWKKGAEQLRIISIGTGMRRERLPRESFRRMPSLNLAVKSLKSMLYECNIQNLTLLQILGRTDTPWEINSEIGDLSGVLLPEKPLFTFQRYDVRLERNWLKETLGIDMKERTLTQLMLMDRPQNIPAAYELAQAAAEHFVKPKHLQYASSVVSPALTDT